ncbi:MAG: nuclear transport factor 2 family protein [Gammaproteobacteria bacterium]|nr:nuclear transport factor 2 family protein [Gammaproteobacteria bacterium]
MRSFLFVLAVALSHHTFGQSDDEKLVRATAEQFFLAIETKDRALLESIMVPGSLNISTQELQNDQAKITTLNYASMIDLLTGAGNEKKERAWDETILVQGHIAVYWAPYDFHVDQKFTHCGIDSFQLIKKEERWLISNASWTRETLNCPTSPLGPID